MNTITPSDAFDLRPPAASAAPARPALRAFRPTNPATALGLAVSHLMTRPAFAALRFGAWSRVLVGQINRGHYRFVLDDADRTVGFLGWVLTGEASAEAWLQGRAGFDEASRDEADCIVFNAWAAETPSVNRFVLDLAREATLGRRLIYFKRYYADGGVRPVRMPVNAFVARNARRGVDG